MTSTAGYNHDQTASTNGAMNVLPALEDPFRSDPTGEQTRSPSRPEPLSERRVFGVDASSSPSRAKRAIEGHLAETDRRLEDAGRLGSALVKQREKLAARLKDLEKRQNDSELPPGLRETLSEIEKEYNDAGRETAKVLLGPGSQAINSDDIPTMASPAVFSSHANASPSKVSVPSRKQRSQATSRTDDVQFAADISSSLLVQVRELQSALADRDESLNSVTMEKTRMEREMESFSQRLRASGESEQRCKDENWNLETQTHEMMAAAKEAADREKKLNASLASTLAEKSRVENELDEIRVSHGKLSDDHTAARKHHDSELHALRRNLDLADNERGSLERKVDELTSQNQELANAVASRSGVRDDTADGIPILDPEGQVNDIITPENSPPPSPTKATPRHGALESETLKSSLHHAHRMIQNLKGNIHREKTEKMELKRMLQDARDEVEQRRADSGSLGSGSKRSKTKPEPFKKSARPDMLGGSRRTRTDVEVGESDWEDHAGDDFTSRPSIPSKHVTEINDAYHTATDAEAAFETANERETTESEDFQTGAESLASDSTGESTEESVETETEGRVERKETIRASNRSMRRNVAGNRSSYLSTASTSAGEDDGDTMQPIYSQPLKYRLKMGRGPSTRRSQNQANTTPRQSQVGARDSPASFGSSPPTAEQSLFAELGDMNGGGSEFSTPGRASLLSSQSTPGTVHTSGRRQDSSALSPSALPARSAVMVDNGTMTEPWEPDVATRNQLGTPTAVATSPGPDHSRYGHELPPASPSDFPLPPSMTTSPSKSEVQHTPLRGMYESPTRAVQNFITPPKTIWDEAHDQEAMGHGEKTIPSSPLLPGSGLSQAPSEARHSAPNGLSGFASDPPVAALSMSPIMTQEMSPIEPATSAISPSTNGSSASEEQKSHGTPMATAGAAGVGLLASVGAALGLSAAERAGPRVSEHDRAMEAQHDLGSERQVDSKSSTADLSANTATANIQGPEAISEPSMVVPTSNQGCQTVLTSEQIDNALNKGVASKSSPAKNSLPPLTLRPIVTGVEPRPPSRNRVPLADPELPSLSPPRRSGSSASQQPTYAAQHPPLPPDHKTLITKAKGRLSSSGPEPFHAAGTAVNKTVMGPPLAPASAYRRPRTSADQSMTSHGRGSTASRISQHDRVGTVSQISRRSSVSSFASELDERFNIRTDGLPVNRTFNAGPETDPRMIQAITQTMIGEFLWKYTRRAGRPDMSNTRHRRYFWVHPYTRTLYWSEQDPQTAGGKELKAKSVAIESVRVVSDDNHMPPGLHKKSLEVVTPGRRVRFTAGTASRHETWFNALSYLLMRGQDDVQGNGVGGSTDEGLTPADVDEFNPSTYARNSRLGRGSTSRASLSSHHSHTTRGTVHSRTPYTRPSLLQTDGWTAARGATSRASSSGIVNASQTSSVTEDHRPDASSRASTVRQGSVSRFSNMFKPSSIRESWSVNHRRSIRTSGGADGDARGNGGGSIYNASMVSDGRKDSAEDIRRELYRQDQEGAGKLENVRACCDGKHDVTDLANNYHHHTSSSRLSRHRRHDSSAPTFGRNSSRQRSREGFAASISSRFG